MATRTSPDKLSVVVFSGDFDKVHYALVMAGGAAAIGTPVTLFFTMGACRALQNPDADGTPAWRRMPASSGEGDSGEMDESFKAKGLASFEELLDSCVAMGVRFLVCEMGLRAMGLAKDDLRADITLDDGGVVTFLRDASAGGAMLFV